MALIRNSTYSRRQSRRKADVNITNLMDVMMVLLVVFMVAAPLMTSGIPLNLPKVGGKAMTGDSTSVNISVDQDGYYYIGKSVVEDDKTVAILEIKEGESTAYYTRKETTPYRQVAYRYTEDDDGIFSISKEVMQYAKVYKYMTLEAFILSLYGQTLRFSEPSKWNDKYEQRFYCAKYNLLSAKYNP